MSLHHNIPPQNPPHLPQQQSHPNHPMVAYGHQERDYHPQTQQYAKQGHSVSAKSKNQSLTTSDDDEPGFTAENSADDGRRKISSPWQRMKWTDNMVRLLIMVVFYIGDEVGSEGTNPASKKKGGGVLQKKGKWKSVSRAMMERGFYVSPQQCEDKFNDLNKRYKRVNDILGKGTSCRVVENPGLLDTMDHLSPKMKEEVKKLLNSKHLFYREMCAYHNSCGHGGGGSASGTGGAQHSPTEAATEPSQAQQQRCLHSTENAPIMSNLNIRREDERSKLAKGTISEDDDDEDDDDEDEEDDSDEEDGDEVTGGGSRFHDDMNEDGRCSRKRLREGRFVPPLMQLLEAEITNVLQDGTKGPSEKRKWMKAKLMQLEEQRVGFQTQSFELEKQRLKWLKFSSKKEREMEREKLTMERHKLENERMVLNIRQKEQNLLNQQQLQQDSSNKKSDPSSITG
jgi:hypothetical protein